MAYRPAVLHRGTVPNLWSFLLHFSMLSLADGSVLNKTFKEWAALYAMDFLFLFFLLPQNSHVLCYELSPVVVNTTYFFLMACENYYVLYYEWCFYRSIYQNTFRSSNSCLKAREVFFLLLCITSHFWKWDSASILSPIQFCEILL